MSDFQDQVLATLSELKSYVDRRDREIDTRLDQQSDTLLKAARDMEKVATVHFDAAQRLARQSIIKFCRGIE